MLYANNKLLVYISVYVWNHFEFNSLSTVLYYCFIIVHNPTESHQCSLFGDCFLFQRSGNPLTFTKIHLPVFTPHQVSGGKFTGMRPWIWSSTEPIKSFKAPLPNRYILIKFLECGNLLILILLYNLTFACAYSRNL